MKQSGIAAVLSALHAGLGQIYNGQIAKGILFSVIQSVNYLLCFVLIGYITTPLFWIYNIYDAYHTAEKRNR